MKWRRGSSPRRRSRDHRHDTSFAPAVAAHVAAPDQGPSPELVDMTRRFWVAAVLTLPLMVMHFAAAHSFGWLQFALATPVVFWCGWPFFERAATSVRRLSPNMFTLIALGV